MNKQGNIATHETSPEPEDFFEPLGATDAQCIRPSIGRKEIAMSTPNASPLERPTALFSGVLLATLLASGAALAAVSASPASIIARNQKPKGDAVSITYAFLPKGGTLDVYAVSSSGKMGTNPLGTVKLDPGDHRNVSVSLNPMPKKGERLRAVIERSDQPLKNPGNISNRTFTIL